MLGEPMLEPCWPLILASAMQHILMDGWMDGWRMDMLLLVQEKFELGNSMSLTIFCRAPCFSDGLLELSKSRYHLILSLPDGGGFGHAVTGRLVRQKFERINRI